MFHDKIIRKYQSLKYILTFKNLFSQKILNRDHGKQDCHMNADPCYLRHYIISSKGNLTQLQQRLPKINQ